LVVGSITDAIIDNQIERITKTKIPTSHGGKKYQWGAEDKRLNEMSRCEENDIKF
jgi:hypothetical protein